MSMDKKNKKQNKEVIDVDFEVSSDALDSPRTGLADPGDKLPDANVDLSGRCVQPAYAENDRPDTGAPCSDGRDGR